MIAANFSAVPAGSKCRPITIIRGDEYYWMSKESWENWPLKFSIWNESWEVRATKRAKGISKKTDK